jgi:hypothetical protein
MHCAFQLAHVTFAWVSPKDYSLAFSTINMFANNIYKHTPDSNPLLQTDFDIVWLRHHPGLCIDRGPDLPNNHLNDPWSAVADFLQNQYWHRVCIFQGVVLTNELVFIDLEEPNLSWSMLRDIPQIIGFFARNSKSESKPYLLSGTAWNILSEPLY